MKINFMTGDITKVAGRFDVIVNAANNTLLGGGGVDGAIHKAAGPGLLEECKTLGECETGSAKITKAYNIPCKGIIHTVGPKYTEDPVNAPILLFLAYINSINVAVANGYKKIAFPSISTGIYKYPVEEAAQIAKRAAHFMGEKFPDLELTWVLFTEEDYNTYTRIFFS